MAGDAFGFGVIRPLLDEGVVGGVLDRHEVVPCGQVSNQRLGVHATQLLFTHRESHHRNVFGFQARIAELFVERHIGVAVDSGHHGGLATRGKFLHVCHDGLVVGMTKRSVFFVDVLVRHAFAFQVGAQDFVGGAGVDIVGTQQYPALGTATVFAHQVVDCGNGLLVRRRTGVKHVFGKLFTLVLHRVEQQAIHFFDDWQHGFAGHRGPATKDHIDLVLAQQLFGFFGKQRPVGRRVHDHRLKLLAQQAALGIDFVNRHQHGVFQHGF